MKYHLTIAFLFFCVSLFAQEASPQPPPKEGEKGVSPMATPPPAGGGRGEAYAVVLGISDYQDEGIPDLRFADKDAEAFANFLRSPAGGNLDEDHLKVLINDQATVAQFAMQLDWLWEVVKENDRVIIYFSGHGDVEKRSLTQPGYLLCWDAPARVYLAGGAMNVRDLNDVVSTLSIQNKAQVILITDACRAGKLSGSEIGGAQATAANLAKQYANEIKILSCQPDEFSIEGEQWGGGRGAFSYHLLDGLYGMADGNGDQSVNLLEIGRYLEDRVTMEVAPQSQIPMTIGGRGEKLTDVFPEILEQLKEGKKGQLQLFTATESRGIEDDVLAATDSNIVEMYLAFQKAIDDKQFLSPANASADFYYEKLSREPQLERLHSSMRRNYAAALQDDAQQVMNVMLKSGLTELILKDKTPKEVYGNYPAYLDRASFLLGEEHYMYPILLARKNFFLGKTQKHRKDQRKYYRKALALQPEMGHAMVEMIRSSKAEQIDSAKWYFEKVTQLVPSWIEPYLAMANYYGWRHTNREKEGKMLDMAEKTDPNSLLVMYRKALYYGYKNTEKAEQYFLKALTADSYADLCFPCLYNDLGYFYSRTGQYAKAIETFEKLMEIDSSFEKLNINLCFLYSQMKNWEAMEAPCLKFMESEHKQIDKNIAGLYLIEGYLVLNRLDDAEKLLEKVMANESFLLEGYVLQVDLLQRQSDPVKADSVLKKMMKVVGHVSPSRMDNYQIMDFKNVAYHLKRLKHYEAAAKTYLKVIQADSDDIEVYSSLGEVYSDMRRYEEAEKQFQKALQLDSTNIKLNNNLGKVYMKTRRYEDAERQFKKAVQLDSTYANAYFNIACIYSLKNQPDEAFDYLEKSIENGFNNYDWLQKDTDLSYLRKQKERWIKLMQKYFSDQHKD